MDKDQIIYINDKLCIPAYWLFTEYTVGVNGNAVEMPSIMKTHQYEYHLKKKKVETTGHPGPNKPAMVIYEGLDENIKIQINAALGGNPYNIAKRNLLERLITNDSKAADFFYKYTFEDGSHIKEPKQKEYIVHAWIFNAFTEVLNNRKGMHYKHIGKTMGKLWEYFSESLNELDTNVYPHKLPNAPSRLKEKYEKYFNNGDVDYESLIHGNHGNVCASKTKLEEQQGLLNRLISDHRNLDNVQIMNLYNIVAEPLEWKKISSSTVANARIKTEVLTTGGRRGLTEFRNTQTMQVKRKAPECALYYWTMDGWDVELLYQKTMVDKKGYSVTTYHNRLTLVVVLDTTCKYPIGYAIGSHETPELIKQALRNAVNHTAELFGDRYKPLQLQSDHYGKGALTPLYEALTDKYTPARVKNAKSKVVEPYFGMINKKHCQYKYNWSGFGITSKKDKQPNSEMLNKFRKDLPNEAGCRQQIVEIMAAERSEKHQQYMNAYNKLQADEKIKLNDESYLFWFGDSSKYTNRLEASGLNVKILGEAKCYDSFDRQFRMLGNTDWQIKFDIENLNHVLAINADGTQRFMLTEKYIQPMALAERKEGDALALNQVNEFNKSLEEEVVSFNARNYELVGKIMEDERLQGTLTKLMLVDSRGQHKDNKNELRKKTEQLAAKTEKKEVKKLQQTWADGQEEYLENKVDIRKYF